MRKYARCPVAGGIDFSCQALPELLILAFRKGGFRSPNPSTGKTASAGREPAYKNPPHAFLDNLRLTARGTGCGPFQELRLFLVPVGGVRKSLPQFQRRNG